MSDKDYKPDWDNIPKEFKYCYYSVNEHSGKVEKKIFSNCKLLPKTLDRMGLKCIDRPPKLVDGAWYSFTTISGTKLAGRYERGSMWVNGGGHNLNKLTIHQRIPDSMWECEDGR